MKKIKGKRYRKAAAKMLPNASSLSDFSNIARALFDLATMADMLNDPDVAREEQIEEWINCLSVFQERMRLS